VTTPPTDERFWALARPLLGQTGVTRSTMMGFACLRLNGDFFACCGRQTCDLVVKLNATPAASLIEDGKAEPFAQNGRPFREWARVPQRRYRTWAALLDDALRCSVERRSR
jgi:hypothetical protein